MKNDTVEYYEIKAGRYSYYARMSTKYNRSGNPYLHGFDFGGQMKGCIKITVEVPNADYERFKQFEEFKKIADISWIGFNTKCSIHDNLPSGVGTRHLIKTAMTFVLMSCNWIEKFSLTDASKVVCKEGIKVSLSYISIVTNGKTYYEKYLGAYLQNDHLRNEYQEGIAKLRDPKAKLPLDDFCNFCNIPLTTKELIGPIYEESGTYIEFFKRFKQQTTKDRPFCWLIQPWVETFVDAIINGKKNQYWVLKWLVDKSKVTQIDIQNSKVIQNSDLLKIQSVFQEEFKEYELVGGTTTSAVLGPNDY